MTWFGAESACNNISGHLVKVDTEEEQLLLVAEIKRRSNWRRKFTYMWIGLNDLEEEGSWRWIDSSNATVSFWGSNQPNSAALQYSRGTGDQDCAAMDMSSYDGRWNDFWCSKSDYSSKSFHGICEI